MAEHTWTITEKETRRHRGSGIVVEYLIHAGGLAPIGQFEDRDKAEYAVRAVNNFEALLDLLKEVLARHTDALEWAPECGLGDRIEAAIAEAEK